MHWMLMPLRRYAEFSGRSRRMEFWMWKLFTFLVAMAFWVLMMIIGGTALMTSNNEAEALMTMGGGVVIVAGLYFLFALAIFIPDLAVTVRRLHDTDRSGWWILAPLAPYLVAIFAGMAGAASGTREGAGLIVIVALVCMLAALALAITLLVFMFLEGTRGPNRFGPDPKAPDNNAQVFA